jgi:MFS family permease
MPRIGHRRLWVLGHLVMALGIAVPVSWPAIGGVMVAALLVGGTFMVITMAGMHEARAVAGPHATGLMAAMTSAFGTGQIIGPLLVSSMVGPDADFSHPLLVGCLVLVASACVLACRRASLREGLQDPGGDGPVASPGGGRSRPPRS